MPLIDRIEHAYSESQVFQGWVIAATEAEGRQIAAGLTEKDHTVVGLWEEDLVEDRPLYRERLARFQSGAARMLVCTFATWYQLRHMFEIMVVPYQNLLAIGELEDAHTRIILEWLADAHRRGFVPYGGAECQRILETPAYPSDVEEALTDEDV